MAELELDIPIPEDRKPTVTNGSHDSPMESTRSSSWIYRTYKIGPFTTPWFASPKVQLGMVAFVCFLCPGMFNALSGMGGGGRAGTDQALADRMVSYE